MSGFKVSANGQAAQRVADNVRSAGVRPRVRMRPLPPWKPFPLEHLPAVVSTLVTEGAEAIGCDPALVALPALAAVAGAIGNSRAIILKKGWVEPPVLWAITVAPSGERKSPGWGMAIGPLMELQADLDDAHKAELKEWKKKDKDERGDEPPGPLSFVTSDATIEAVGEMLRDNPRGVLLSRDELDAWFQSMTKYKGGGGGTDRANWLELHRAGLLKVNRITRERGSLLVRRAMASVCGTIQPSVLAKAIGGSDSMASGLAARFLLAMPPKQKREWTEAELSDPTHDRYQELMGGLLKLELLDGVKRKPHVLGLSTSAKQMWVEWFNEWGEVQHDAEGEQAACFAKIEAYSARLALIHHVVNYAAAEVNDRTAIGTSSMRAGIELARWFANEATRIYMMFRETEDERDLRRLVEWIKAPTRDGVTTVRDLQKSNSKRYSSADLAKAALDDLVAQGLACWEPGAVPPQGGHPVDRLRLLDPTPDTSDTRPAPQSDTRSGPPSDACPDAPQPRPSAFVVTAYNKATSGQQTDRGQEASVGSVGRRTQNQQTLDLEQVSDATQSECRTDPAGEVAAWLARVDGLLGIPDDRFSKEAESVLEEAVKIVTDAISGQDPTLTEARRQIEAVRGNLRECGVPEGLIP